MNTPRFILALLSSVLLISCASNPSVAPTFKVPSTTLLHDSTNKIEQSTSKAQSSVDKAIAIAKKLPCKEPAAQAMIVALNQNLFNAQSELKVVQGTVVVLQGQLKDHDAKLKQQTAKANKLSGDYNKLKRQDDKNVAIVKQVNAYWGLGAFAYGFVRLVKHLLICLAVLVGLGIVVFGLSLAFPEIIPVLKSAGVIAASVFARIASVFRKKQS